MPIIYKFIRPKPIPRKMNLQRLFFSLLFLQSFFSACHKPYYLHRSHSEHYSFVADSVQKASTLLAFLQPYKIGVDTQMQVIIGHTDMMLTKAQPESSLGNFIADAQLIAAKKIDKDVAISVMNYGGIRLSYISPGTLTKGKLYELMPFDNILTLVEIPGHVLQEFCDLMARYKGWPVSGMSFTIKDKKATHILINGSPLHKHLVYKMAVSDYIAKGGDNCDMLRPLKKKITSVFVRDAMIEYVMELEAAQQPLHPLIENRVIYAE